MDAAPVGIPFAFSKAGYEVDAADGSPAMVNQCRASGMDARLLLFEDLKARDTYDGVWACSSLLHCSRDELSRVIPKVFPGVKARRMVLLFL